MQSALVRAIADSPVGFPFVAGSFDVEECRCGSQMIGRTVLRLTQNVFLRDGCLQAPAVIAFVQLPILAEVGVVGLFCGEVAALSKHAAVDAVKAVVGTVLQLVGERTEFLHPSQHVGLGEVGFGLNIPVAAGIHGIAEKGIAAGIGVEEVGTREVALRRDVPEQGIARGVRTLADIEPCLACCRDGIVGLQVFARVGTAQVVAVDVWLQYPNLTHLLQVFCCGGGTAACLRREIPRCALALQAYQTCIEVLSQCSHTAK